MPHVNDRIEDVKNVIMGISKDIHEVMTTVQLSIPVVEEVVGRVERRIKDVKRLLGSKEKR